MLVVVNGEFLVECLDFLRGERKNIDQFQKEFYQVLILLMLWVLDFWCGISRELVTQKGQTLVRYR